MAEDAGNGGCVRREAGGREHGDGVGYETFTKATGKLKEECWGN